MDRPTCLDFAGTHPQHAAAEEDDLLGWRPEGLSLVDAAPDGRRGVHDGARSHRGRARAAEVTWTVRLNRLPHSIVFRRHV